MPPHLAQPCCVALGRALDSGLISRHGLWALSIGFLFPKASCSRVHCSWIQFKYRQNDIIYPLPDLQFQLVMQDFSSKLHMEPTNKSEQDPNRLNNNNNNNNNTNNNNSSSNSVATLRVLQTQSTAPELENLENNIKKLESDLHEAKSRNLYLSELVENQKR